MQQEDIFALLYKQGNVTNDALVLLQEVYAACGNHMPPIARHVLPPGLRDRIRDLLIATGRLDAMAMQTLRERDDAEQALSQAYYLVVGRSPEWSSAWHHQECLDEIKDACTVLRGECQRLEDENKKLRKIACHVPGAVYIKAKEDAGFGEVVRSRGKQGE